MSSFAADVFNRLNNIDCSDFITEKGGSFKAKYISWSDAWRILMNEYPESYFIFNEEKYIGNSTCEVSCTVTIKDGDKELSRSMWLPVMANTNQSIADPTTRQISDARMRCLVKCLALFGLGLFIYQGEDVPTEVRTYTDEQHKNYWHFAETRNGFSMFAMLQVIPESAGNDLYNSALQGGKTEFKKRINGLVAEGAEEWQKFIDKINTCITDEDSVELKTLIDEVQLNSYEKEYLNSQVSDSDLTKMRKLYKEAEKS